MIKWKQTDVPDMLGLPAGTKAYLAGRLSLILSTDNGRLHMSIAHQDRYPTWDEIKEAREFFLPLSKHFAMGFPRPDAYVNTHENCFHLWELLPERDEDLIWTFEQC